MGKTTEVLEFLITAQGTSAVQGFHQVGTAAEGVNTKLATTEGAFGKLKSSATGAMGAIGLSATTLGVSAGAAIAGFAVKAVSDFQASAQAVLHFKEVAGGTAESASRWVETFNDYGVSADTAATLVGKLAKTAETAPAGLETYGASVVKAKDGSIDLNATLMNVIDTMHNAPDEASRAALGTAAFGRGWQTMAKLVDVGAAGVKADFDSISGAQIFSEKQLSDSEKFRLAMDDLSDAMAGVENKIGEAVIPILTDLIGTLENVASAAGLIPEPLQKIFEIAAKYNPIALPYTLGAKALDLLAGSSEKAVIVAEPLNKATGEVAGSTADMAAQTKIADEALKEAAKAYKDATDAIVNLGKAQSDQANALRASSDSSYAADKAARELSDTFEALPDKLKKIEDSTDSAAKKTRDQQQAYDDAAQAAVGMADSQVKLDDDTKKAAGSTQTHTGALDVWNASILTAAANSDGPLHEAIVNHIADVNGIPPEKVTEILASTPNLDEQKKLIDEASAARKLTITADANTDPATRAVNAFIANVESHPAYIDVIGRLSKQGQAFAAGGPAGGVALVGEQGPELVALPNGSYVYTAAETRKIRGYASGGTVDQYGLGNKNIADLFGPSGTYASSDDDPLRKMFGYGTDFSNWLVKVGPYSGQTLGSLFGPDGPFYRTGKDALEVLFGSGADFANLEVRGPGVGDVPPPTLPTYTPPKTVNAEGPLPFGWWRDAYGLHSPSGPGAPMPATSPPPIPGPPAGPLLDAWGLPMTGEVGHVPMVKPTPPMLRPESFAARAVGGGGRQAINITITGGLWMGSKTEIGRQLVEAIKAYERTAGPAFA